MHTVKQGSKVTNFCILFSMTGLTICVQSEQSSPMGPEEYGKEGVITYGHRAGI